MWPTENTKNKIMITRSEICCNRENELMVIVQQFQGFEVRELIKFHRLDSNPHKTNPKTTFMNYFQHIVCSQFGLLLRLSLHDQLCGP